MNVATPTKDWLELVYELLIPIVKARGEKNLTRQEVSVYRLCNVYKMKTLIFHFDIDVFSCSSFAFGESMIVYS